MLLSIQETKIDAPRYEATLSFDNGTPYCIVVNNPFSEQKEGAGGGGNGVFDGECGNVVYGNVVSAVVCPATVSGGVAIGAGIEFNDRYSQASTYHQLGSVAEEQEQWQEAKNYFLLALRLFVEFQDEHNSGIKKSRPSLSANAR